MNLFGVMDLSGSALKAERVRAEVVASNMANAETTHTAEGGPYRRQSVVFQATGATGAGSFVHHLTMAGGSSASGENGVSFASMALSATGTFGTGFGVTGGAEVPGGVQVASVVEDGSAPLQRYDPGHPDADANGYVSYPDINPLTEMVDLMGATRAYGANASALQAEKNMVNSSLDILKS